MLLSGEPGIGKSRLTAALLERLATEPHTRFRYFCSPQHTDSALYPIIRSDGARRWISRTTTARKQSSTNSMRCWRRARHASRCCAFAEMLSLPNDGRYPALELTPQQRRQKTLEALTAQVEALARQNPVLMIFEDVHWTDPQVWRYLVGS